MSTSHLLRHLHLPSITPFTHAQTLQSLLVSQFLTHKAALSSSSPPSPLPPAPLPTILTFSPTPFYTTGRRELGTLTASQTALLRAPLPNSGAYPIAEVTETLRGGQTTFHGPGQLVIYPILDLKSVRSATWPRGLTARCFVNLLEQTTINVLGGFGVKGIRTENPGVWIDDLKKVAALGVHLRRNVTSYGVGLNVCTDLRWFDRIVACGLEGKKTTSLREEGVKEEGLELGEVARLWVQRFVEGLWGEEGKVVEIEEEDITGKGAGELLPKDRRTL